MLSEIEQFIDRMRLRSPRARTWRDYKCDLELFSRVIGDLKIPEIHPRQLDDFVNYQVNRGFKPGTVNRRLSAVASLYRFLIAGGKAERCPVLQKRHYLREPERLPRPVNEKDLRKFFAAITD